MGHRTGLIVDFGGVLTSSPFETFSAFCEAEGLASDTLAQRFRGDDSARGMLEDFECGRLSTPQFEQRFGALLGVAPERLVHRILGGMAADDVMVDAVRAARRAGVRTAMLSNSWGEGTYDRELLPDLFDAWVISGEEGMRKPEPAIYELAVQRLGLPAAECVFVDDLPFNLKPARELGMATVHHVAAASTIAELEALLGVELGAKSSGK